MTALVPAVESFFTDYPEAVVIPMNHVGLLIGGPILSHRSG